MLSCVCSELGLSFADSAALFVRSDIKATIRCPERMPFNLHSSAGEVIVDKGATLTFQGCDVLTVASPTVAAQGPLPPGYVSGYFGESPGLVRFVDSRLLLPSEVRSAVLWLEQAAPPSPLFGALRPIRLRLGMILDWMLYLAFFAVLSVLGCVQCGRKENTRQ